MLPEDSLQSLAGSWWTKQDARDLRRGRLVRAFLPHVDQEPLQLVAEGRASPTDHRRALFRIEALYMGARRTVPALPVAALPPIPGEIHTVQRSKVRPALVISTEGADVPKEMKTGAARWLRTAAVLVAPYYGTEAGPKRGGWKPELVLRIRRAEYPQWVWDELPIPGSATGSILRLDHIQPVSTSATALEWTPHCLTDDALGIVDEWIGWFLTGKLPEKGNLYAARQILMGEFA